MCMNVSKEDLIRINKGFGGSLRSDSSLDFAFERIKNNMSLNNDYYYMKKTDDFCCIYSKQDNKPNKGFYIDKKNKYIYVGEFDRQTHKVIPGDNYEFVVYKGNEKDEYVKLDFDRLKDLKGFFDNKDLVDKNKWEEVFELGNAYDTRMKSINKTAKENYLTNFTNFLSENNSNLFNFILFKIRNKIST